MTVVKVCGLMDLDAALTALEAGADLLGFVFAAGRRQLSPAEAAVLLRRCRDRVPVRDSSWQAVGVFANQSTEFVQQTTREVGLDLVQLSGSESAEYGRSLGIPFIRTLHMDSERSGPVLCAGGANGWERGRDAHDRRGPGRLRLLTGRGDACVAHADGSPALPAEDLTAELRRYRAESGASRLLLDSGSPGRWGGTGEAFEWERMAGAAGECMVAGGLTPANVSRAISILHPWGVDASSGVETAGHKDPGLIRQFVTEVKRSDHDVSK